ncbi:MAG: cupin domain-containing protein [Leptospiraceae bacterium]|nr:cupin domain-containing protein [Leptospiraceae bacterium]
MSKQRHPHIIHSDDLDWVPMEQGERFASKSKRLGAAAGAAQIGCSLYAVPPGKTAFPYHAHAANEEAIYILAGEGRLRLGNAETGEESIAVRSGDYIVLPAHLNNPHQLINNGQTDLTYLCFSTLQYPEIATYPDSDKVGMLLTNHPSDWPAMRGRGFKLLKDTESLGYYDGE